MWKTKLNLQLLCVRLWNNVTVKKTKQKNSFYCSEKMPREVQWLIKLSDSMLLYDQLFCCSKLGWYSHLKNLIYGKIDFTCWKYFGYYRKSNSISAMVMFRMLLTNSGFHKCFLYFIHFILKCTLYHLSSKGGMLCPPLVGIVCFCKMKMEEEVGVQRAGVDATACVRSQQ